MTDAQQHNPAHTQQLPPPKPTIVPATDLGGRMQTPNLPHRPTGL